VRPEAGARLRPAHVRCVVMPRRGLQVERTSTRAPGARTDCRWATAGNA